MSATATPMDPKLLSKRSIEKMDSTFDLDLLGDMIVAQSRIGRLGSQAFNDSPKGEASVHDDIYSNHM